MKSAGRLDYSVENEIAFIRLNRAPVNAIDHPMIDGIHAALRQADRDTAVRTVIITSALDGMFCGGMDLKMVARGDAMALREFVYKFYIETMDIQYRLSKPTIAVVNGPARGAGMTLSVTCDMVLAADDIDLGYPEIDVGLIPAIHYVHLPRQISRHKAFELLFTASPISAHEAAQMGLINHAVPRVELMDRAVALARVLAEKSPTILALGRASFLRANDLDYRRNVENQIETLCNVFATADGREGINAFVEKRRPLWRDPAESGEGEVTHNAE